MSTLDNGILSIEKYTVDPKTTFRYLIYFSHFLLQAQVCVFVPLIGFSPTDSDNGNEWWKRDRQREWKTDRHEWTEGMCVCVYNCIQATLFAYVKKDLNKRLNDVLMRFLLLFCFVFRPDFLQWNRVKINEWYDMA